jgi:L-ribulokinase
VKLWKHHGAVRQTEHINRVCEKKKPAFLPYYGGKYDSEWPLPKLLELREEAPEVYNTMAAFPEAGDWVVWQLTGNFTKCVSSAGVKEQYDLRTGSYPSEAFLGAIDIRLRDYYVTKLSPTPRPLGTKAGNLTPAMAEALGLSTSVSVSVANMDGHVSAPVVGMERPGQLMAVIGTSCGWFALTKGEPAKKIPGICCAVEDSMWPGMVCYEAGQSCVGDIYKWLTDGFMPPEYHDKAVAQGLTLQQYLTALASKLHPGESGLLMLDWLNGNRSILSDARLSGMILGLTLQTKPEEVYRAALEACAYGARMIVENYVEHGIKADSVIACGGISRKNALAMQIYADVLGLPIHIAGSEHGPAHGSALFAAVAAGCYPDVQSASAAMKQPFLKTYEPCESSRKIYDALFAQYKQLYQYFGQGGNDVMKVLMDIRQGAGTEEAKP